MLYMLLFEKLIRDEQQKVTEPILNDDNDQQKSQFVILYYLINGCKSERKLRKD